MAGTSRRSTDGRQTKEIMMTTDPIAEEQPLPWRTQQVQADIAEVARA